jgi:Fic family protein
MTITGAATATATRDLAELVTLGALTRAGDLKSTRYHLAVEPRSVAPVMIDTI